MEKINIVYASDNKYAKYLGVSLTSIQKQNITQPINVTIIDGGISFENKKKILSIKNFPIINITFFQLDKNILKNLEKTILPESHINLMTYCRLIIPKIINEKFIYMDCDTICLSGINNLYNTNLDNFILSAASDIQEKRRIKQLNKLTGQKNKNYFNAGVLLIDSEKWENNNITEKTLEFAKNYSPLYHDQDSLNYVLKNNFKKLDQNFNYQQRFYNPSAKIIHLLEKPWEYYNLCSKHHRYLYKKYLMMSPWKNEKIYFPDKNLKKIIKKHIIKILNFIHIWPYIEIALINKKLKINEKNKYRSC